MRNERNLIATVNNEHLKFKISTDNIVCHPFSQTHPEPLSQTHAVGWTQGHHRELIRQRAVVNDGPPHTAGLQPPAAWCTVWPPQRDWRGDRLTFRPGTCCQGCMQKKKKKRQTLLSCWRFTFTVYIPNTSPRQAPPKTLKISQHQAAEGNFCA